MPIADCRRLYARVKVGDNITSTDCPEDWGAMSSDMALARCVEPNNGLPRDRFAQEARGFLLLGNKMPLCSVKMPGLLSLRFFT